VAHSSRQKDTEEPKLCKLSAQIAFSTETLVSLEKKGDLIELTVTENGKVSAAHCLSIVLSMLRKLNEDVMHGGLLWQLVFDRGVSYETAKQSKLQPWFSAGNEDSVKKVYNAKLDHVDLGSFLDAL